MRRTEGSVRPGWLISLVIMALLAGGGFWYWKHLPEEAPDYRTAVVAKGDVIQAVTATGQLNPVVNVQVGSQVSGIISRLYVDFNSAVTNGQLIAQLDPSTFKAARDQAQGDLANAQAAQELSQLEWHRADEMLKTKLISQDDFDKAVADYHQSQAMVMIKQAALESAQVNLDRCTIYSPIDGVVISRNVDVGQTVAASLSAPVLFVIANDLAKMQIDAAVSEADVGGIKVGQNVNFTVDAFPSRTFQGSVVQVRNAAVTNQNVVTYDTVIGVDNRDLDLKPGMTANVSITTAEHDDVLRLPNGALRFRPPEVVAAAATNLASAAGGRAGGGTGGGGGGPRGMGNGGGMGGGGPGGPGGGGGGGGRRRGERSLSRMVYVPAKDDPATAKKESWKAVQIKVGISDGLLTEVTDGLQEGDEVIVGQNNAPAAAATQAPTANPFGGGRGGRGF